MFDPHHPTKNLSLINPSFRVCVKIIKFLWIFLFFLIFALLLWCLVVTICLQRLLCFPYTFYSLQSDLNKYLQVGQNLGDLLYIKFYLNHKGKLAVQSFFLIEENFSLGCVKMNQHHHSKYTSSVWWTIFMKFFCKKEAVFQLPSIDFTFGLNI